MFYLQLGLPMELAQELSSRLAEAKSAYNNERLKYDAAIKAPTININQSKVLATERRRLEKIARCLNLSNVARVLMEAGVHAKEANAYFVINKLATTGVARGRPSGKEQP